VVVSCECTWTMNATDGKNLESHNFWSQYSQFPARVWEILDEKFLCCANWYWCLVNDIKSIALATNQFELCALILTHEAHTTRTKRDYQHSTVDSTLMLFECDAMWVLLLTFSSSFYSTTLPLSAEYSRSASTCISNGKISIMRIGQFSRKFQWGWHVGMVLCVCFLFVSLHSITCWIS
jgi:hypothetical protein